ncbi:MAG: AraC family transcriptional regulator, partial [Lachnospiraceae bacterium]|nr:AraC family transcriptional regulator [Lachnospiraceae bacterium]
IINWLEQYSDIDTGVESYYQQHRRPTPEDLLFRLIQENHGLSNDVNNLFQNIDASIDNNSTIATDSKGRSRFSDHLWLQKNLEVSIRKHPRYLPLFRHTHSFIEMAYVYRGSCNQSFYYDNGLTEEICLKERTLCIIPPELQHTISVFDDSIVINILIRTSTMKHALTNLVVGNHALFNFFSYTLYENTSPNYILFDTAGNDVIKDLILDMMLELCENKNYSQKVTHLMLGLFFTYLQRDHSDTMQFSKYTSSGIDYIPQILSYIQENYRTTSVEDIAHHFYISRSYLSRVFKAYTNTTVIQTLQRIRIQHACDYLQNTRLSVQNISDAVGYGDVTFFIRTFKKITGVTPLQYRKRYQI